MGNTGLCFERISSNQCNSWIFIDDSLYYILFGFITYPYKKVDGKQHVLHPEVGVIEMRPICGFLLSTHTDTWIMMTIDAKSCHMLPNVLIIIPGLILQLLAELSNFGSEVHHEFNPNAYILYMHRLYWFVTWLWSMLSFVIFQHNMDDSHERDFNSTIKW